MSKPGIKNATLFVTVLSACLGLLVAGASSQAHQTASSVLSEIASVTSATISYRHASNQRAASFTAVCNSPAPSFVYKSENRAAKVFYQNTDPLIARNHILVVTSLPRASLDSVTA